MFKIAKIILAIASIFAFNVLVTASAPVGDGATVLYNGIEFRYAPEVFGAVLPKIDEGTPYEVDAPYFANVARHTSFQFVRANPMFPDQDWIGDLSVYRISDIEEYGEQSYKDVLAQLRGLLGSDISGFATVGTDGSTPTLPFMPVVNAAQTFRAHPRAFNSALVTGIEYYTYFSQAAQPVIEGSVLYTFQGITADGLYYISFSIPVDMGLFDYAVPADLDWNLFQTGYPAYLEDVFTRINTADAMTFTPSSDALTTFIESISMPVSVC